MAAVAHFTKALSRISPATKLAMKYSLGTKDLMKTIEPIKTEPNIQEPVTVAGQARADAAAAATTAKKRSAASYLSSSGAGLLGRG